MGNIIHTGNTVLPATYLKYQENNNEPQGIRANQQEIKQEEENLQSSQHVNVKVAVRRGCSSSNGCFLSKNTTHLPAPPSFHGVCAQNEVNVEVFADRKNN